MRNNLKQFTTKRRYELHDKIVQECMGWAIKVNKIKDEKLLDAYKCGLEDGITKMVRFLKEGGFLNEIEN